MFLLFGFDTKKSTPFSGENGWCFHCNNTIRWQYFIQTNWFSLFFIPVIPFNQKYYKACPICTQTTELTKQEYDSVVKN